MEPVVPARLVIPSIGVSASLLRLGLRSDGTLEVPENFALTGWWSGGATPGERGPAVIVGLIDSKTGPAVFYRLRYLSAGDKIKVIGRDRSIVWFEVERLEQHPKDFFPTERVYGDTHTSTLRLVTCGGEFNDSTGHYLDNIIAFASLARS